MKVNVNKVSAVIGLLVSTVVAAQAPARNDPNFDPAKLRAEMEAFMKMPDTVGTGKYPALKEEVASLPDHVIYRPADLSKLGKEKLGVLAWGNGGCAPDGAGGRFHLAEIASHGYLVIAKFRVRYAVSKATSPYRNIARCKRSSMSAQVSMANLTPLVWSCVSPTTGMAVSCFKAVVEPTVD